MDNKKKEAEKRKRNGEELLNKLNLSLDSQLLSIGIVFDNLSSSSMNIDALNSINYIFNNFIGVDTLLFSHEEGLPCVFLLSPILDLKYIFSFEYPLIATSPSTLETILGSNSKNLYYYSYNKIEKAIDPRVKIITMEQAPKFNFVEIIKIIVKDLDEQKRSDRTVSV